MFVSFDGGFGQWKICTEDTVKKGESIVGSINKIENNELVKNKDTDMICIEFRGKKYIVGKDASIYSSNAHHDTGKTRNQEDELIKLLASLCLIAEDTINDIELAICLPLSSYHSQKESYKNLFQGIFHVKYLFDNEWKPLTFKINKVKPILQGLASAYDFTLDSEGDIQENEKSLIVLQSKTAVIDPGYKTTEVIVLDNMKYNSNYDLPLEYGIKEGYGRLIKELARDNNIGIVKQLDEMPEIVREGYLEMPNKIDISNHIDKVFSDMAKKVESDIEAVLGDIRNYKCILFTGGGSNILYKWFNRFHENTNCYLTKDPEFSNVKGALKYINLLNNKGRF